MTRVDAMADATSPARPLAQFDGVCIEARDAGVVAEFWAVVLSGTAHYYGGGRYLVKPAPGRPRREIVRVNTVPDVPAIPSRAHLDVRLRADGPQELLRAGARVVRGPATDPWYVLADPEGNEFCTYSAVDARPPGIFEFVVKCHNAPALARWWADVLGGEMETEGETAVITGAQEFPWDYMVFDPVPEPKQAKNRLHWHVELRDRDPGALTSIGAGVLREPEPTDDWWVLADPEGNEFCASVANL